MYKHHVLFFHNQNITQEQQRDFALQSDSIHVHPLHSHAGTSSEISVLECGENVDPNFRTNADRWHTDVSWSPNPPIIGICSMQKLYQKEVFVIHYG